MNEIRKALARLTDNQRKQLMYAFECMVSELIIFEDRTFIGCNLKWVERLEITQTHGAWSIGKVKNNE